MNPNIWGPASLAMTQGFTAFNAFLPKITDVRKNNPTDNPDFAGDVRLGEVAAASLTVGMGLIASSLTGSPVPTVIAALVALGLVFMYESVLRADRPMERKTSLTLVR